MRNIFDIVQDVACMLLFVQKVRYKVEFVFMYPRIWNF